ncbi:diguanylate cyclase [Candidatus Omnitrophota bacterium]
MEELDKLQIELAKVKTELRVLYEISNAMRTTLKLEEILYIILTGVTAHSGLSFNRALLFLVDEKQGLIEGRMALGPKSNAEADRIWNQIENEQTDLNELISTYRVSKHLLESEFNRQVRNLVIPLQDKSDNLLAMVALERMPLHLTRETVQIYKHTPLIQLLDSEELILVPLKARDRVNGIIVADNFVTKRQITKDNLRMLTMLATQAGLAIENSQLFEEAVVRSQTDSLTGLWNHGYFQYLLRTEVEKARAAKSALSLIMLDIDDFKVYNDKCGHQAGDRTLKELAQLLKNQSRRMDFVCRYGGEEFVVILPETDKREALLIAKRLNQDVRKYDFPNKELLPEKEFTVSLGVSAFPIDGDSPSSLISHSDKGLYQAKHKGKDKVSG